jgi:hypothetical protein
MENPPPYSPPPRQPLQQEPTPQREHVQQFVQHNPQGFVLKQQPYQPQTAGFSDISGGYGYNQTMPQQMPPPQMTSTQTTVIVRTKFKFLKRNPGDTEICHSVSAAACVRRTLYTKMTTSLVDNVPFLGCFSELSIIDCSFGFL